MMKADNVRQHTEHRIAEQQQQQQQELAYLRGLEP